MKTELAPEGFTEVSGAAFYQFIGPLDVTGRLTGRYPYTTEWLTRDGTIVAIQRPVYSAKPTMQFFIRKSSKP